MFNPSVYVSSDDAFAYQELVYRVYQIKHGLGYSYLPPR